jgi:thiol:disulfide interchange protein DsbD
MIPITLGIVGGREGSKNSRIVAALLYVLGLALTYATVGFVWAFTTSLPIFGSQVKEPLFVIPVIAILLFVAASLFGLFEASWSGSLFSTDWIRTRFSSEVSAFLLGVAAGFIQSPCITPPLLTLLSFVTDNGNPFFGFALFFAFAMGMSFLLLLIAFSFISLEMLPRSGAWLEGAKKLLGYAIVFVALSFLQPFCGESILTILYAVWAVVGACIIALQWHFGQKG